MSFGDRSRRNRDEKELQTLGGHQLSEDFLYAKEALDDSLKQLQRDTASIQRLVAKLGTVSDCDALRTRLRECTTSAKESTGHVSTDLRKLKMQCSGNKAAEKVLKEEEHKVAAAMQDFRVASQENVKRQRQLLEEEQHMHEEEEGDDRQHLLQDTLQQRSHELDWNEQFAQQRKEEIQNIESTVVEIFEIFKELDAMVNEQGEQLDQVAETAERGRANVEAGREQLVQSNKTAQRSRRLKCYFLFCLVIAIAIIVLWGTNKI